MVKIHPLYLGVWVYRDAPEQFNFVLIEVCSGEFLVARLRIKGDSFRKTHL